VCVCVRFFSLIILIINLKIYYYLIENESKE
jgi:hypothetical protein